MSAGATGYGAVVAPFGDSHDHTWQLQSVILDDGICVDEFHCVACGAVDYR